MRVLTWRVSLVCGGACAVFGWIGATAQDPPDYEFSVTPPIDEAKLKAYRFPVESVDELSDHPTIEEVDKAASIWLSSYRLGMLQEVGPVSLDDMCDRGPKLEILNARTKLSSRMGVWAKKLSSTDPDKSAELYLDIYQINQIFKHTCPDGMLLSTLMQQVSIVSLIKLADKLSPEGKARVACVLESAPRPSRPLESFTLRLNASYIKRRQLSDEHHDSVSYELLRFAGHESGKASAKSMAIPRATQDQGRVNDIAGQMVRALHSEQKLRDNTDALLQEISQLPR